MTADRFADCGANHDSFAMVVVEDFFAFVEGAPGVMTVDWQHCAGRV